MTNTKQDERTPGRSDLIQADASADASSEKVNLPSEQEAFLLRDFRSYLSREKEFVDAYRAGLSSAMSICDLLADEYGQRTKATRSAHDSIKRAADRIEYFRSKCSAEVTFSNEAERDQVSLNQNCNTYTSTEALREALAELLACDDNHDVFDIFGLADGTDNNGTPYQSQYLAEVIARARTALAGVTAPSEVDGE